MLGHSFLSCCWCLVIKLCPALHDSMDCSVPGLPVPHHLLEFIQVHVHRISDAILLSYPLLPSIFPSIKVFSNGSAVPIRWPKYRSFSFSISPSNEYSGVISFRIDSRLDSSLLQHHSSKASIFQWSAFFMVQLSHPYMTTGKTKALTRWIFVGKVMSLLFTA